MQFFHCSSFTGWTQEAADGDVREDVNSIRPGQRFKQTGGTAAPKNPVKYIQPWS